MADVDENPGAIYNLLKDRKIGFINYFPANCISNRVWQGGTDAFWYDQNTITVA